MPKQNGKTTFEDASHHIYEKACGSSVEINYNASNKHDPESPFFSEWVFGLKPGGKVINLSRNERNLIAFSNAHVVVLYDYKEHSQRLLHGHKNAVTALSVDSKGLWLASADSGDGREASSVVVWDIDNVSLARVLPGTERASQLGYRLVAISPDGLTVVAVTEGVRPEVLLWHWREESSGLSPDSTLELSRGLGQANGVVFNPDAPHFLMVTCDRNVAFLTWQGGQLQQNVAELLGRSTGRLLESTYQTGTPNAVTVTSRGFIIIWTDPPVYSPNSKVSRQVFCVDREGLSTVTEVDKVVVIGTTRGHVRFYDQDMNLLHWYKQADSDSIATLSFALNPSVPDGDLSWVGSRTSFPTTWRSLGEEDGGEDLSRYISGPSPAGTSRAREHFRTRDLIVSTARGELAFVSFHSERCVLLQDSQAVITVIQAHTEKAQLLIGRANGSIALVDYLGKQVLISYTFETRKGLEPIAVTSLKYSPNGLVLACGLADGRLYFLHPELLHPIASPQHRVRTAIHHLCFSPDSMFLAHSDRANFVSAYRSSDATKGRWVYLGKKHLHAHGFKVRFLMFGPQFHQAPLFSLGEDLVLVEYDVANSINNTLLVSRADKVDQNGVPRFCTWCPDPIQTPGEDPRLVFLIATSEFKYKLVDPDTRQVCGTYQGPRLLTPVRTIKAFEGQAPAYAVFGTERRIGLQILPPDGNPFKSTAVMAHPVKIMNFVISAGSKYVFTFGRRDHAVMMWRVNEEALDSMMGEEVGGDQSIEPWLLGVEGGRDGWLFKEMQEAFCYAQLLHQGTHSSQPRQVGDTLPICELPDVMRALGYFPSQFEISNMVRELMRRQSGDSLSFADLVKLYVNHKPLHGISVGAVRRAFNEFAYPLSELESAMTKEKFLSLLLDKGEAMDTTEAQAVLHALLNSQASADSDDEGVAFSHLLIDETTRRERMFHFLPETITFSYLMDILLGVTQK